MPQYEYNKDFPFAAFITNLGKYNEGELVGEWVQFPTTYEKLQEVFKRIGIGERDEFGHVYEEWFITDYDCYVDGLYDKLGEYENLDELNYLASKLDEMSQSEYDQFMAAMSMGDYTGSIRDLINLCDNLDCYDIYPGISDDDDLGRYFIEELGAMEVPEYLRNYIDYEAYGRDIYLGDGGEYTDFGYVVRSGSTFHEFYNGDRDSIPEEYRVMSSPDGEELTEDEKSEWAMDIAFDLDEYFRQRDPQYAVNNPDMQAGKETLYEKLTAGRIAPIEEMLRTMGKEAEDAFAPRLEAFKKAMGYRECLDVDTDAPHTAIPNPNEPYVAAMAVADEKTEQEHAVHAAALAAEIDSVFRNYSHDYHNFFPKGDAQRLVLAEAILEGRTPEFKTGLINLSREMDIREEVAPLLARLDTYEKDHGIGTYMVYQLKVGDETRDLRFESLDRLEKMGLAVNPANYELVYAAPLIPGETLETIYRKLNVEKPDDFHGHSLSVSDVVVLREHGKDSAHYCDRFGFTEVPVFLKNNPLRTVELTVEDDCGMIDGVINNGRRDETQGKPSVIARLEAAKRECAERKPSEPKKPGRNNQQHGDL